MCMPTIAQVRVLPWTWAKADRGIVAIPNEDRTDIAIIQDAAGKIDFEKFSGIKISNDINLFSTNMIIAVFTMPTIGIKNILHTSSSGGDEFIIQLYDTGIFMEIDIPPPGMHWAQVHLLIVDNIVANGIWLISTTRGAKTTYYGRIKDLEPAPPEGRGEAPRP